MQCGAGLMFPCNLTLSLSRYMCCECMSAKHPCLCRQYALRLVSYISGNHYLVGGPLSPAACQLFLLYREILRHRWVCQHSHTQTNVCIFMVNLWNDVRFSGALNRFCLFVILWNIWFFIRWQLNSHTQFNAIQFDSTHAHIHVELCACKHTHTLTNSFPSRCWHQHQLLFMS